MERELAAMVPARFRDESENLWKKIFNDSELWNLPTLFWPHLLNGEEPKTSRFEPQFLLAFTLRVLSIKESLWSSGPLPSTTTAISAQFLTPPSSVRSRALFWRARIFRRPSTTRAVPELTPDLSVLLKCLRSERSTKKSRDIPSVSFKPKSILQLLNHDLTNNQFWKSEPELQISVFQSCRLTIPKTLTRSCIGGEPPTEMPTVSFQITLSTIQLQFTAIFLPPCNIPNNCRRDSGLKTSESYPAQATTKILLLPLLLLLRDPIAFKKAVTWTWVEQCQCQQFHPESWWVRATTITRTPGIAVTGQGSNLPCTWHLPACPRLITLVPTSSDTGDLWRLETDIGKLLSSTEPSEGFGRAETLDFLDDKQILEEQVFQLKSCSKIILVCSLYQAW